MSNTAIKLKKSSVVGKAPLVGDLTYGELAINYADGKLYYKNSSNQIKSFVDSDLVSTLVSNEISNLTLLDSDAVERISRTEIEDYLGGHIATDLIPDSNEAYDIGSPTKRFKELYLSGNHEAPLHLAINQNPGQPIAALNRRETTRGNRQHWWVL